MRLPDAYMVVRCKYPFYSAVNKKLRKLLIHAVYAMIRKQGDEITLPVLHGLASTVITRGKQAVMSFAEHILNENLEPLRQRLLFHPLWTGIEQGILPRETLRVFALQDWWLG